MRKFLLLMCIPFIGLAQTDYELELNSATQDYVHISNASSVIANKTAFSISCWVNPQNNTDHSGIMGFRNNTDADFYLLQMQNTNNVEARFRGSSGVNYDIVATNLLDFNQWQHLAFTYDGSYIRLYKDGALVDSSVANGIIGQNTLPLQLGKLDWGTTGFYMTGRLDEIRLWDVALSQTEINSWMCTPIDLTHPNYNNLMGYWKLNDGQGTIAYDQTANGNNGTLMGGAQWQIATTCLGTNTSVLKTYVPDDSFENYLEANGMGDGVVFNDSVPTASIEMVMFLNISGINIYDLTGIEDFIGLVFLDCQNNQLTTLDMSNNIYLTDLIIASNQLTNLNISQNTALISLGCSGNYLTSLDVSANTALTSLQCDNNQLTSLDLSNNTALTYLNCSYNNLQSFSVAQNSILNDLMCSNNQLTTLDLRNGNNISMQQMECFDNPTLSCINVDNEIWSTSIWTTTNGNIDAQHYFSTNCSAVAFDCTDSLEVTDVIIDNGALTMNIAIYNGYNSYLSMPYVAFTIDANGDTIQQGNMNLFGAINLDTSWYNYSINSAINPSYPLTMYFVYAVSIGGSVTDTCILTYNSTPTAITDINPRGDRKLISIIDVLGRESKGTRNEPFIEIYDDGTVEKRIVIE